MSNEEKTKFTVTCPACDNQFTLCRSPYANIPQTVKHCDDHDILVTCPYCGHEQWL